MLAVTLLFLAGSRSVSAQTASPIVYDFEEFGAGATVTSYTKDGLTMTISATAKNSPFPSRQAKIFDSANPTCGDADLGTPNETFGGPGEGEGGEVGKPGANDTPLGNVLIVQEVGQTQPCAPDDASDGGIITLQFSTGVEVTVNFFELLDIEGSEQAAGLKVEFYNAAGVKVDEQRSSGFGNNSYEEFVLNIPNVNMVKITFPGSGSIPSIIVTPQSTTAGLGDYVWLDSNDNGIQDDGVTSGVNGVTVNLLDGNGNPVLDSGNNPITTVTTNGPDGNPGFYQFLDLTPGDYIVEFIKPSGFDFTTQFAAAAAAFSDSNADTATGRTNVITLAAGDYDPTIDAGIFSSGTLAVSLSYAYAERTSDDIVYFIWETATETGNAGFNLYMEVDGGVQNRVTPNMVPSRVVDSVAPVRYTYQATVAGDRYYIEMVDIDGGSERLGPFALGEVVGEAKAVSAEELVNDVYLPMIISR